MTTSVTAATVTPPHSPNKSDLQGSPQRSPNRGKNESSPLRTTSQQQSPYSSPTRRNAVVSHDHGGPSQTKYVKLSHDYTQTSPSGRVIAAHERVVASLLVDSPRRKDRDITSSSADAVVVDPNDKDVISVSAAADLDAHIQQADDHSRKAKTKVKVTSDFQYVPFPPCHSKRVHYSDRFIPLRNATMNGVGAQMLTMQPPTPPQDYFHSMYQAVLAKELLGTYRPYNAPVLVHSDKPRPPEPPLPKLSKAIAFRDGIPARFYLSLDAPDLLGGKKSYCHHAWRRNH